MTSLTPGRLPEVCVCYLIRSTPFGDQVLLGRKKSGLGEGRLVGPGGKIERGESPIEAIVREVAEEVGLVVSVSALRLVGELDYPFPHRPAWSQKSWVFVARHWRGEPRESDELAPEWFPIDELPTHRMWDDARYWVDDALRGEFVAATFEFGADLRTVVASDHPRFSPYRDGMTNTSNYPHGEAGEDSESGPVDAAAADGAQETAPPAEVTDDGSLAAGSSAHGSPTEDAGNTESAVERTAAGKPHAQPTDENPEALVEGNRVATAKDME